ncbi:MAG: LysR-family transcriptional regulator [Solirubrobacteraceae bacterium]|nr:LysR-family transcriptional regulator [Solirubrobacteraceae bacterium]
MAEERHFTQAARRLAVAQSTVSSSVRSLEREFGAPLFTRTTRRVALTEAGTALLPDARRALAAADLARASVDAVTGLRSGKVTIGTGKALRIDFVAGLVRFCSEHPSIDVSVQQGGSVELLEAVSDGRVDFAPLGLIGPVPEHIQETVHLTEVRDEPMLFACSPKHPFAERKAIRLFETLDERFVDFRHEWAIRIVNDRRFAELGRDRRIAYEMNDVDDLLEIVRSGLAVAVVPESVSERSRKIRFIDLRGPAPTWSVGVAVPRGRPPSPAARALFQTLLPGLEWPESD